MELKAWQQVPFPTEPFHLPFFFLLESKARVSNTLGTCSTIELWFVVVVCLFFVLSVLRQDLAELPRVALTSQCDTDRPENPTPSLSQSPENLEWRPV